ncbi:hypothetical protein [Mesorhizobium sp. INR15]|uniref:hypothetical protein n=1 Tax=Mesorhizobium sp. INR15 TaxID=2654248 RepID=UPI0018965618|nr:hypothetical protein [Mesorhizobium sp. INR15]QPC95913.1 hypothetical protein GA829_35910 [Mesorhizobium sp. INR15]
MAAAQPPDDTLPKIEKHIAWVLAHPGMSAWLKDALRTSADRDPVDLLGDLAMLSLLLKAKSHAAINQQLGSPKTFAR